MHHQYSHAITLAHKRPMRLMTRRDREKKSAERFSRVISTKEQGGDP